LIHDRDRVWGADLGGRTAGLGIKSLRTPIQAPRANGIAERWVRTVLSPRFLGLFLLVSLLYALRDSMRGLAIVMTLLVTSSPALTVLMQGGLLPQSTDVVTWIFLTFEFGGMAVVSAVGLWMLRRAWRRARAPVSSP
jgi:hypothetical protein